MKKIIISLMAFAMFFAVGCSEENATDINTQESSEDIHKLAGRGTVWDGEIGIDDNGVYKITADEEALKADLEAMLKEEGKTTKLETLEIKKLIADNDPADSAYMLIGSDGMRISTGVFLVAQGPALYFDTTFVSSVSCDGCPQGCNLNYLIIEGKKVPFCNEMGCMFDCELVH